MSVLPFLCDVGCLSADEAAFCLLEMAAGTFQSDKDVFFFGSLQKGAKKRLDTATPFHIHSFRQLAAMPVWG